MSAMQKLFVPLALREFERPASAGARTPKGDGYRGEGYQE